MIESVMHTPFSCVCWTCAYWNLIGRPCGLNPHCFKILKDGILHWMGDTCFKTHQPQSVTPETKDQALQDRWPAELPERKQFELEPVERLPSACLCLECLCTSSDRSGQSEHRCVRHVDGLRHEDVSYREGE